MKSSVSEWVAVVGQKGLESDDDTELHRAANEKQVEISCSPCKVAFSINCLIFLLPVLMCFCLPCIGQLC